MLFHYYYSISFYSILFYSILFYSILFYSILFYSILFYSILFYSILFYSILFSFANWAAFGWITLKREVLGTSFYNIERNISKTANLRYKSKYFHVLYYNIWDFDLLMRESRNFHYLQAAKHRRSLIKWCCLLGYKIWVSGRLLTCCWLHSQFRR